MITTKRLFDIALAFILLLSIFPIFIVLALLIILDSGFPVFFVQYRMGLNGRKFKLLKFRTMRVLNEAKKGTFDVGDISRVTGVGKILRKTKLDELPQLINVFVGNMSFVGPRPEIEKWTNTYSDRWEKVLSVKPGITDNASIKYRNEEQILSTVDDPEYFYRTDILPKKLDCYEEYVDNQSILGDFKIIFKTVYVIFVK